MQLLCDGADINTLFPDHWAWDESFKALVSKKAEMLLDKVRQVCFQPYALYFQFCPFEAARLLRGIDVDATNLHSDKEPKFQLFLNSL